MAEFCKMCGQPLQRIDIAATMKFINRGATEYYCTKCLAAHYEVSEERLFQMIEYYRKQGCALFS